MTTPATEVEAQNREHDLPGKMGGVSFLYQYFYSLLFGYCQEDYKRLPDIWVNINKSTHDIYKGPNMSLPPSAPSFTNRV